MDPDEIRLIWKAFIKERGAEIFRKISPSPILWELFIDSAASSGTAIGSWQFGNELPTREWTAFSKAELSFPILFVEPPVYSHLSQKDFAWPGQAGYRHHRSVAKIVDDFIAPLPISRKGLLQVESVRRLPVRRPSLLKTVVSIKSREPVTVTNYEMVNQPPSLPPGTCNCDHSSGINTCLYFLANSSQQLFRIKRHHLFKRYTVYYIRTSCNLEGTVGNHILSLRIASFKVRYGSPWSRIICRAGAECRCECF